MRSLRIGAGEIGTPYALYRLAQASKELPTLANILSPWNPVHLLSFPHLISADVSGSAVPGVRGFLALGACVAVAPDSWGITTQRKRSRSSHRAGEW